MEFIAYFFSILIGISLGLIGGGGSILTVPVLVYLFHVDAVTATGYSLFIVGMTSLIGTGTYFKQGLVDMKTAIIFGIPSIIAVYLTRAFVVPAIPQEILSVGSFTLSKGILLLLIFAGLMIMASYSMIKKDNNNIGPNNSTRVYNYPVIIAEGSVVGVLTGLVGAGGGFLIIPALVILSKLPMKEAVGTSLVIIAAKSLLGFAGEVGVAAIDWPFLLLVTSFASSGIFIGALLSKKIDGAKLKPAFGWFILVMGIYIIVREVFLR